MLYGWEGNRTSGVALAMRHSDAENFEKGDKHPAYAALRVRHLYPATHSSQCDAPEPQLCWGMQRSLCHQSPTYTKHKNRNYTTRRLETLWEFLHYQHTTNRALKCRIPMYKRLIKWRKFDYIHVRISHLIVYSGTVMFMYAWCRLA